MQDKGQTINIGCFFVFQLITLIDAQPELIVSRSATADLNFPYTKKGFFVVVILSEKSLQLFSRFG